MQHTERGPAGNQSSSGGVRSLDANVKARVVDIVDTTKTKIDEFNKTVKDTMTKLEHVEKGPDKAGDKVNAKGQEKGPEKSWVEKVSTKLADIVRDIDTASKMAQDKFDGDSALMRSARGTVSMALGAGMEKVTDMMWEGIWNGQESFIERFKLPEGTGKRLHNYAASATEPYYLKARLSNFAKEGTQDLVIGAINNMIAFRSQPILQKVEAIHLLRSLAIDAGQSFLTPSLGEREQKRAKTLINEPNSEKIARAADAVLEEHGKDNNDDVGKNILTSILNLSNPVTHLGIDMVWSGLEELKKNLKDVRDTRKEKGIVGKSVEMPKKFEKKEWGNRDQGGRWQGNRDKVYYGKSNWKGADQKAQEEYELKADKI